MAVATYAGFPEFLVAWVKSQTADLQPLLADGAGVRVTPYQSERKDPAPRVTYRSIDGVDDGTLTGPSGLKMERWEVHCWGTSAGNARLIARLMIGTKTDRRLDGYQGTLAGVPVQCIRAGTERDESESLGPGSDAGNACIAFDLKFWGSPN